MTLKIAKPDPRTLELTPEGTIDRADYARFEPEVDAACARGEKVRLLLDVSRLGGWTLGALWEDVKFDLRHFDDVDRVAVVGDPPPAHWLAALARPFTTAEVAYFEGEDIDAARTWLRHQTPDRKAPPRNDRQNRGENHADQ